MYTQINIEELLNLFKEKGYHITTKRETDMTRLVYDGIIVGTFSPDLYTYNDYDVINVGSMVEIRGFQRHLAKQGKLRGFHDCSFFRALFNY